MRNMLMIILAMVLVGSAAASDLFPADPFKPPYSGPRNVPVARQGGDTVLDAVEVTLPVIELAGTTAGYNDDYDEACPFPGDGSPDVVYTFVSDVDLSVKVDLCGSSYDTKVYVYDEEFNLVGCNDDFYGGPPCGLFVSLIYGLPISAGTRYYVVIDGYGNAFGDYLLTIDELDPCDLDCPPGAEIEGEPPLTNDYVDSWNGGCQYSSDNPPFQPITVDQFCGMSGMYLSNGAPATDTDWFELVIPEGGMLEVTVASEQPIQMWQIITEDCVQLLFWQVLRLLPCEEGTMTISGTPGESILLLVFPRFNNSPDGADVFEFNYTITTNLAAVRTESRSLSKIKGMFR
jgi:hypothetical protein